MDTTKYNTNWNSANTINAVKASYQAAISDTTNGIWFVNHGHDNNGEYVRIAWTRDPNAHLNWLHNPNASPPYDYQEVDLISDGTGSGEVNIQCDSSNNFWGVRTAYAGVTNSNLTLQGHSFYTNSLFYLYSSRSNFAYNFPTGYEGLSVMPDMATDIDGDGLVAAEELAQGTSDTDSDGDTDNDGISDLKESIWYQDRDDVFCGATECAYPNPAKKDLYVEIDWMKEGGLFGRSFKPSNTQLDLVKDMYANAGIIFHADTGQYGGGNELSTYTQTLPNSPTAGQVDYWDYRNGGDGITANFSSDRNFIWHYMIEGYNYAEHSLSSGWAVTMGGDLFISGGLIRDMTGLASEDRAIANSIAHELGHNLCLSDERVSIEQPSECIYDGIDNNDQNDTEYNLENYQSVMNYRYQLTDQDDIGIVNYSDGSHGTGDHDDWAAVMLGMKGFSSAQTQLGAALAVAHSVSPDGKIIINEAPIDEIIRNNDKQAQEESQSQSPQQSGLSTEDAQLKICNGTYGAKNWSLVDRETACNKYESLTGKKLNGHKGATPIIIAIAAAGVIGLITLYVLRRYAARGKKTKAKKR